MSINASDYGYLDPEGQKILDAYSYGFDPASVGTIPEGQPLANSSGAQAAPVQSGWQTVLSTLTSLFDKGVEAYNDVAQKTGLPLANGQDTDPNKKAAKIAQTQAQAAAPVFLGMNQSQLLLIGGGAALILVLMLIKRR